MNQARYDSIVKGLSAIARKVFDVVPMATAWDTHQIMAEIARRNISVSRDLNVIEGCLRSLVDSGIVRRVDGAYRRIEVAHKLIEKPAKEPEVQTPPTKVPPAPPKISATDTLIALSQEAAKLGSAMAALSKRIDDAVLDIEQEMEAERAQVAKVRQVAELLKSL